MRIRYDAKVDSLLFSLRDVSPVDVVEEPGGVIINCGADGEPVSVEFTHALLCCLIRTGEISVTRPERNGEGIRSSRRVTGTRCQVTGVSVNLERETSRGVLSRFAAWRRR